MTARRRLFIERIHQRVEVVKKSSKHCGSV
jgi:hypothetical protein